ncbi:MAG: hypothetical protein INF74_13185, partial [Roseomonas sp.]|nr:hypothetical protein [Roseomonas sp.]
GIPGAKELRIKRAGGDVDANRDQKIKNPPGLAADAAIEAEPLSQGHGLFPNALWKE